MWSKRDSSGPNDFRFVDARRDPTVAARVIRRVAMRYAAGADPAIDRPPHIRAASGMAWVGPKVAVIQDDANFIALVDPATGLAEAVSLPPDASGRRLFDDGRRNKADKLDHEALASITTSDETLLVAFGSGSMPRRESIAVIHDIDTPHRGVRLLAAPRFYAGLRASATFAGSELNVEGAIYTGGHLRLFGRGNGAAGGARRPVNATCDIEWAALRAHIEAQDRSPAPAPMNIIQYELGTIDDARLTFTDATLGWSRGNGVDYVFYSAAAERSLDATTDGVVVGSAIGVIEEGDGETSARWTELRDHDGRVLPLKVEGIALADREKGRLLVVVDVDAHDHASELVEVELEGSWPG